MDDQLFYFLNHTLANPLFDALLPLVGWGGLALCPATAALLAYFGWRRGDPDSAGAGERARRAGLALLAALIVGLVFTLALQYGALRPRPADVRLVGAAPNFPSFPSGHAMAAAATAVVLGLAYGRRVGVPVAGLALLVAFSRVYQGHHYPSDVLGGAVLGVGMAAGAYARLVRPTGRVSAAWLLWPQLALVVVVSELAYLGFIPLWVQQLGVDKVLHFAMFGLVAFGLYHWLGARGVAWAAVLAVAVPFTAAAVEESLQSLSPYRTFDLLDLACDLTGMVVMVGLAAWAGERRKKEKEKKVSWVVG